MSAFEPTAYPSPVVYDGVDFQLYSHDEEFYLQVTDLDGDCCITSKEMKDFIETLRKELDNDK